MEKIKSRKKKRFFICFFYTNKPNGNDEAAVELNENKIYYEDEPSRHTDVIYLMKIKFHFPRRQKCDTRKNERFFESLSRKCDRRFVLLETFLITIKPGDELNDKSLPIKLIYDYFLSEISSSLYVAWSY